MRHLCVELWASRAYGLAAACCFGLAVATSACESPAEMDCTLVDPFPWGILVDPVSSVSGARIEEAVTGTASDGAAEYTLDRLVIGLLAATVPEGTYDVTIRAEGFQDWSAQDITTQAGECGGFVPVELEARLIPAP